jgi:hypothetical protein
MRLRIEARSALGVDVYWCWCWCWQVGGTNVPVNSWTWVDWSGSNSTQKVNYTFTAGNHTLKLIGSSANVLVDKVILLGTGEQCSDKGTTPTGDGSNCAAGPTATPGTGGTQNPTPVSSGSTTPSIVEENKANVAQTSYVVNGKVVQTSPGPAALDTKKLTDGTYTVETIVKLKDGTEVKATEVIAVKNNKTLLQKNKILIVSLGLAAILAAGVYIFWRLIYRGRLPWYSGSHQNNAGNTVQAPTVEQGYVEPQVITPDKKND